MGVSTWMCPQAFATLWALKGPAGQKLDEASPTGAQISRTKPSQDTRGEARVEQARDKARGELHRQADLGVAIVHTGAEKCMKKSEFFSRRVFWV